MINILEYQYGSDKGSAAQGTTFASPLGYQGMNPYYTTASVDGETIEVVAGAATTLGYGPVKGTVKLVATDGQITEVTPVDGAIPADAVTAGTYKAFYLYDNETVPVNAPQIKLNIKSLPVETQSRKLSAIWAFDAQYELSKEYGQDMQQLLATQATAEIEQEIDNEITLDLQRIANAGPEITWSRVQPVGVNKAA